MSSERHRLPQINVINALDMKFSRPFLFLFTLVALFDHLAIAQADYRPGLFFREDWKEIPAQIPITPEHVANPDLIMSTYGPGADSLKKSNHEQPVDDPYYIWSGRCLDNWAMTLKHKIQSVDLSKFARIKWRSKQAGYRHLRVILKLSDGQWLVSDVADGPSDDWRITEFVIDNIKWRQLDIENVVEGRWVVNPDLSSVEEIGFTDLMRGGNSAACSRLDWIEVYGFPVN